MQGYFDRYYRKPDGTPQKNRNFMMFKESDIHIDPEIVVKTDTGFIALIKFMPIRSFPKSVLKIIL